MPGLTFAEARRLRQMADDLVECTRGDAYWLGDVRDTSLAILREAAEWFGDACGRHRAEQRPLPCVRPADHIGPHLDALGRSWEQYGEVSG